ncbi:MAG TPA: HAD family hydrolase [Pyrinomonadaceae bacterium]|jgi:D-glycero-D-manno-heptose 1,7-bisphosphate phosphatase
MKRPAVFIDRDGTLIEEVNFLHRVEELQFFPFTDESVKLLKENGFLVVLVTNQSGIGRGIYTVEEMNAVHDAIQDDLTENLDAIYFCPHLPNAGCACRKPNLGMIESAMADLPIDLENSWMIGDKNLDVELGLNAGIKPVMVMTGYGKKHFPKLKRQPFAVAANLLEAVKIVLDN